MDWPVPNPSKNWDASGYGGSLFFQAARAYQIWDKTDPGSLQWQEWIETLEQLNKKP